jgi:hypothetical protein
MFGRAILVARFGVEMTSENRHGLVGISGTEVGIALLGGITTDGFEHMYVKLGFEDVVEACLNSGRTLTTTTSCRDFKNNFARHVR